MHRPETFPMEALLRATTLERSQAEALQAMLTRPVALIQRPPGSGKVRWGVAREGLGMRVVCKTYLISHFIF